MHRILQIIRYNVLQRGLYGITSPLRITPDFIVIGAKRCGTTSLYHYLGEHPCIKRSSHDHLGFFDDNFHLGIQFYRSFFPTILEKKYLESKEGKCLTYDVTSSYIYNTTAAERIFHALPHVKIVVILRNPIDRAYSEYNLDRELNPHIETFETLVNKEIEEIQTNNSTTENERHTFDSNKKNYLRRGLYYDQLKHWFNLFPRENILILSTEDFATDANEVFNTIFKFLNLKSFLINKPERLRKGTYPKLGNKMRERLTDFYSSKNMQLYKMIGKDLGWEKVQVI